MTPLKHFSLLLLLTLLSACSTDYGPNDVVGGFSTGGYSEKHIDGHTLMINFSTNGATPPYRLTSYVLYRAADLTIDDGYNYFIVSSVGQGENGAVAIVKMFKYPVPGSHDAQATLASAGPVTQ